MKTYKLNFNGREYDVVLKGGFYTGWSIQGDAPILALWLETPDGERFADVTKGFGEFIGQMFSSYMDGNALYDVESFLKDNHIAFDTGYTKKSGFCTYPLYRISPFIFDDLFTEEEKEEYFLAYDFFGDMAENLEKDPKYIYKLIVVSKESYCKNFLQEAGIPLNEEEQKWLDFYERAMTDG